METERTGNWYYEGEGIQKREKSGQVKKDKEEGPTSTWREPCATALERKGSRRNPSASRSVLRFTNSPVGGRITTGVSFPLHKT